MQTGAHRKRFPACRKRGGSGAVAGQRWQRAGSGAAARRHLPCAGAAARAEGSGPPAAALPLPPSPLEEESLIITTLQLEALRQMGCRAWRMMNFRQRMGWIGVGLYLLASAAAFYYVFEINETYNKLALEHIQQHPKEPQEGTTWMHSLKSN
ncbi:transmembrane protein 251 isoform X2 [Strigops habroptila]|uniref:transmembrane protein 251 isoform X2 n=1 Tax=Strigops habroptila TaxID=2489341 RepID=UPI0011CFDD75|nr:transmembrane protein 251 isoform X2 [Strigops habroptila]